MKRRVLSKTTPFHIYIYIYKKGPERCRFERHCSSSSFPPELAATEDENFQTSRLSLSSPPPPPNSPQWPTSRCVIEGTHESRTCSVLFSINREKKQNRRGPEKKNARERAYLTGLETVVCWRGCGGVARGWRLRAALLLFLTVKNLFLLPSPSFFFSFSVAVCSGLVLVFWFRFPSSRFVSVLLSLSCLISLLPLSSGLLPFLFSFLSLFGLLYL